jgi:flagellar hook assembly protein FlgD
VIDEAESATDVGGGAPQIGPGGSITITPNPMRHTADFRLAFPRTVAALEQSTATPRIEIYDSSGRRVRVLATDREGSAASFRARWNGADDEGRVMSSGVYFARAAASARSTRFVLLR